MSTIYFQPLGINPKYCEVGTILKNDPDYVYYLDEPCKVLLRDVKIIPKEKIFFDKKSRLINVIK